MSGKLKRTKPQILAARALEALRQCEDQLAGIDSDFPTRLDGRLNLFEAAQLAQSLHHVTLYLPWVVQAISTVLDVDGRPAATNAAAEADRAARALYHVTERMMRDLDPHYGPHGRRGQDAPAAECEV